MRVKIGDRIFDSLKEPIMIIFDENEKEHIANMGELFKYCSFPPEGYSVQEIEKFMEFED
jgi:sorbitol-specific phosphotransferase system component IIA